MRFSVGQLISHKYSEAYGMIIDIVPAEKKYRVVWFGYEGTNLVSDFYIEAYDNEV